MKADSCYQFTGSVRQQDQSPCSVILCTSGTRNVWQRAPRRISEKWEPTCWKGLKESSCSSFLTSMFSRLNLQIAKPRAEVFSTRVLVKHFVVHDLHVLENSFLLGVWQTCAMSACKMHVYSVSRPDAIDVYKFPFPLGWGFLLKIVFYSKEKNKYIQNFGGVMFCQFRDLLNV